MIVKKTNKCHLRDDSTVDIKFNALHLILVLIYAKLAIKLKCSLLWAHEMWNVLCQQIKMWIKLFDKLLGYCIKIANVQSTIRKSWQLVFEVFPLKTSQIAIIQFWEFKHYLQINYKKSWPFSIVVSMGLKQAKAMSSSRRWILLAAPVRWPTGTLFGYVFF